MARRPGYVLIEAVVTYLILSFSIVALMPIFVLSAKSNLRSEQALVASHLAAELMEEIKLRKWDEAAPDRRPGWPAALPSSLGPDPGENGRDKRTFNDVDDFDGWEESPPRDPVMTPWPGFEGYARKVVVRYRDDDGALSGRPSGAKSVSVCVLVKDSTRACLERLFANR